MAVVCTGQESRRAIFYTPKTAKRGRDAAPSGIPFSSKEARGE